MANVAITCAVITLVFLGGLAVLIAWLADRTKAPAFSVATATITGFNFSTTNRLNATFSLSITAHNRDPKYFIIYHVIVVSVHHSGYTLAYQSVSSFTQPHGDATAFTAQPTAQDVIVSDPDVARQMRNETQAGQLGLEVLVRAAVRFQVTRWKHRHYTLKVICSPVGVDFGSGKRFQRTDCHI
ncbi:hypothetical protein Cgig2_013794 [Carnegiea gigantea]|uniref:Late embryogenesis abundant protein LEA-2 subgroup domain-containing protein n=1 Tax=Carnegiea gigantea TaxID=171969 RepID=A0A9Q1JRT8_9CARY|nr:hypothetical protein Cgig2_013794 [Carnegiea gigantea]